MSSMMRFTVFVALTEEFHGSSEDLIDAWQEEHQAVYHVDFDIPEEAGSRPRLVELMAKGLLWEDHWSPDDVVWTVVSSPTQGGDSNDSDEAANFFSDREANPHDGSMYGEPEGVYGDDSVESIKDIDLWDSDIV